MSLVKDVRPDLYEQIDFSHYSERNLEKIENLDISKNIKLNWICNNPNVNFIFS
jgi:hypothetical protein